MKINTTASTVFPWLLGPVFAPAGEDGAGAEGEAGETNTGGDAGADTDTGIASADNQGEQGGDAPDAVLNGGTAEGQDNPGEGKGEGDDSDGEDEGKTEDGEAEVPDEYDFTQAMPEGMEMDQGLAEAVTPVFKDLGLTQDQAVALTEAYAGHIQTMADQQAQQINDMVAGWVDTAKADKEIGHAAWKESVDSANKVIREFGTPELVNDVLVQQGMGNHPEVIRLLARIGKAVGDDSLVTGTETDTGEVAPKENLWYGDTTPTSKRG